MYETFLVEMCSSFNDTITTEIKWEFAMLFKYFYLSLLSLIFGCALGLPVASAQEAMTVNAADKNVGDALAKALKKAALKKITVPGSTMRSILTDEVAPHSGQFISSYKVTGGSGKGWVNLETSVDVSALRSIFAMNRENFKSKAPKALILVRGHNGNSVWRGAAYDENEEELAIQLEAAIRARLKRRGIQFLPRLNEYLDFVDEIDENSAATLKAIAQKVDADLVVYIAPDFRNDPESRRPGLRFFIKGLIYDNQRDLVLGAAEQSVPMWLGERAITSKNEKIMEVIQEHIDNTIHEVFMLSGAKLLSTISSVSYVTLRVVEPPDFFSVDQLREGVGQLKGVRFIVERKIAPGVFDFWVDSEVPMQRLKRELRGMSMNDYSISILKRADETPEDDTISIRLEKKTSTSEIKREETGRRKRGA